MSAPIPVEQSIAWNVRVKELSRMSKARLVQIASAGHHYVYGGPAYWSKDELINEILREEFSAVTS